MEVWFTGDSHFNHANIMKYCGRPFSSVKEMDETIIENWNRVVKPSDDVYHLGDFAFVRTREDVEAYVQKLNGRIHLIFGNHDKGAVRQARGFVWKDNLRTIGVGNQSIVLCHYAMRVWNKAHYGSWQLYGHSHGNLSELPNLLSCDVGVDCWSFTPVSFEQVQERMERKTFVPVDRRDRRP